MTSATRARTWAHTTSAPSSCSLGRGWVGARDGCAAMPPPASPPAGALDAADLRPLSGRPLCAPVSLGDLADLDDRNPVDRTNDPAPAEGISPNPDPTTTTRTHTLPST